MKFRNLFAIAILFILATSATMNNKTNNYKKQTIDVITDESFAEFLSQFEKKELPYNIGLKELYKAAPSINGKQNKLKAEKPTRFVPPITNSEYVPDSRLLTMSRMGPPEILPVARFYLNEKMVAIVYSSVSSFGRGLNKNYMMHVYDLKGNLISSKNGEANMLPFSLAHSSVNSSTTCSVDAKGRIWKNTYENIWKKDVKEHGVFDNKIIDHKITNSDVFEMNSEGRFEKMKEIPTTSKASLN